MSFSKAGILYADMVTTVSKSYAKEIQTEKYGFGYDGLLREKASQGKLIGITNAIDYAEYNRLATIGQVWDCARSIDSRIIFRKWSD